MDDLPPDRTAGAGGSPAADRLPDSVTALLRRRDTWATPPPSLQDDVPAAVRRERDGAASPAAALRATEPDGAPKRRGRTRRVVATLALAACAAGLGGAAVVVVTREPGADIEVALVATPLAPGASGTAEFRDTPSGVSVELDIDGLRPAPDDSYYQAWLKDPEGELVTIGTFHARDGAGDVVLWSGVDPADYPTITVTLQGRGEGAVSSGQVVLLGTVD